MNLQTLTATTPNPIVPTKMPEAFSGTAEERAVRPPVLVLSSVRAGSTLLRLMLDRHPQIFAPAELHLLPFASLRDRRRQFRGTLLADGLLDSIEKLLHVDRQQAREIADSFAARGWDGPRVSRWFRERCAPCYLVDKSPTSAWSRDGLADAEASRAKPHYIYLKRHPLAVMESVVRNGFDRMLRRITANSRRLARGANDGTHFLVFREAASKDPWRIAEEAWGRANRNAVELLRDVPEERQTTIDFESLVHDPETPLRRICKHLGLPFDRRMCTPHDRSRHPARSREIGLGDPNFLAQRRIHPEFAYRWQRKLNELPALSADSLELAAELGYDDHPLSAVC